MASLYYYREESSILPSYQLDSVQLHQFCVSLVGIEVCGCVSGVSERSVRTKPTNYGAGKAKTLSNEIMQIKLPGSWLPFSPPKLLKRLYFEKEPWMSEGWILGSYPPTVWLNITKCWMTELGMKQSKLSVGLRDGSPKIRIFVQNDKVSEPKCDKQSNTESLYLKSALLNTTKENREQRKTLQRCNSYMAALCQYH